MTQSQEPDDLTRRIQRLLSEWRLTLRWAVTGSTAPEYSDLPAGLIHDALATIHLPQVNQHQYCSAKFGHPKPYKNESVSVLKKKEMNTDHHIYQNSTDDE